MNCKFLVVLLLAVSLLGLRNVAAQTKNQPAGGRYDLSSFSGSISGQVLDSLTREGVEFASIAIFRQKDSSLVNGTVTDKNGSFKIDKLSPGQYYVDVKFIGYNARRFQGIAVSPRTPEVNIGKIMIVQAYENLSDVVITGEKRMLQYNLDKKVINVEKDIASQGGTAIDVLQNVPSVNVDTEGNISLRGSENVNVLIDGRPSNLTSLDELPAQMIESVEVITNPSARYDPDGLSGIINIVLKKKKDPGYNGMASIMLGTGGQYNGTLNFNWNRNKWNIFANYDFRVMDRNFNSIAKRTSFLDSDGSKDSLSFLAQNTSGVRNGAFHSLRGGFDYSLGPKATLSFTGNLNIRDFDSKNLTASNSSNSYSSYSSLEDRNNIGNSGGLGQMYSLNFKKTYDAPGKEWTADLYFSRFGNDDKSNISNNAFINSVPEVSSERSNTDSWSNMLTFQTDYVRPVGNGGRLEAGVKSTIRKSDSDYQYDIFNTGLNTWDFDSTRSNHFIYDEQIYAAYGIYSNSFGQGKFSYQLGVRVEDQIAKSDQQTTGEVADTNRLNFFPSAHIRWEPNSSNSFQVSYSRRVNRPMTWILNPFLNTADKYNWSMGNPYLEPEFTTSLDFNYGLNFPSTKVSASVYYRDTQNGFSRKLALVDSVTTLSTFINLSHNKSYGVEGVVTQNLTKWWRLNASYSYFKTKLYGDIVNGADEGTAWTAKLTSFFNIKKKIDIQVNGNYRSPILSASGTGNGFHSIGGAQGKTKEMYWVDLGARISVLNNKGTITVRASDIFNTQKSRSNSWDTNFTSYSENWRNSQMLFVGFSYKINNYKARKVNDAEMDQTNDFME